MDSAWKEERQVSEARYVMSESEMSGLPSIVARSPFQVLGSRRSCIRLGVLGCVVCCVLGRIGG